MKTLNERIAALEILDAARTPGNWSETRRPLDGKFYVFNSSYSKKLWTAKVAEAYEAADARYIAASPKMMDVIRELAAENAHLKTASQWIKRDGGPHD